MEHIKRGVITFVQVTHSLKFPVIKMIHITEAGINITEYSYQLTSCIL
jgi:hypothetical protein